MLIVLGQAQPQPTLRDSILQQLELVEGATLLRFMGSHIVSSLKVRVILLRCLVRYHGCHFQPQHIL